MALYCHRNTNEFACGNPLPGQHWLISFLSLSQEVESVDGREHVCDLVLELLLIL